jgi:hypothetical protein
MSMSPSPRRRRTLRAVHFAFLLMLVAALAAALPGASSHAAHFTANAEIHGLVAADQIVVERGVTLKAVGDLHLKAAGIRIDGEIVAGRPTLDDQGRAHAVNIEVASAGDLIINGRIVGGEGVRALPAEAVRGVSKSGAPLVLMKGLHGGRGGSVTLRAGPSAVLHIASGATVVAGRGGDGVAAKLVAHATGKSAAAEGAHAVGGAGGEGGAIVVAAAKLELLGQLVLADGGNGGGASAHGGDGAPLFVDDHGTEHLPTLGGFAWARAGDGGRSGALYGIATPAGQVAARELARHIVIGHGGTGGNAEAHAGVTGNLDGRSLPAGDATRLPLVSPQGRVVSTEAYQAGESRAMSGRGGDGALTGGAGGAAGAALSGKAADGVPGRRDRGGDGGASTAIGAAGGDGSCSFLGIGGDGGPGNDATAGAGGNGGNGSLGCSMSTATDSNHGGRGGDNTAQAGRGGSGPDCFIANGAGGRGGSAVAEAAAHGGNGGCCSAGGNGANASATGGAGGGGDHAGDGGNAASGFGGAGGLGGPCFCQPDGPQLQGGFGGSGGAVTSKGGAGGNGIDSDSGGNGGNAASQDGGSGGNAGSGEPGGVAGSGGLAQATAGQGGGNGGHAGQGTTGAIGHAGVSGGNQTCPGDKSILSIAGTSTNTTTENTIFEILGQDGSQLRCCSFPTPALSSAATTSLIVGECLSVPLAGVTVTTTSPTSYTLVSQKLIQLRVCAVPNSETCPASGSACGPLANIGVQTIYGQIWGAIDVVPTLTFWGLAILIGLLAIAAFHRLRRHPAPRSSGL